MTAIDVAVQAKRLGAEERDDRLSPRRRADDGERLRAASWRRPTACVIRTGRSRCALEGRGGTASGVAVRAHPRGGRQAGRRRRAPSASTPTWCSRPSARSSTAGDARRPGASNATATAASSSTPSGAPRARRLGRRRLRLRRPRPDGQRGRGRQAARRMLDRPPRCEAPSSLKETRHGRSAQQFRRHQVAQPVLARLGAADRQGLQCRARLQGRLGRRGVEDARRGGPPIVNVTGRATARSHGADRASDRLQQHRADHRPRRSRSICARSSRSSATGPIARWSSR